MIWHRSCIFTFMVTMIFFGSCQMDPCGSSPPVLIGNMEELLEEVKEADYEIKSDRWDVYDDRFRTYYEDCYESWESEMTFSQKTEFAGLVTRYVTHRFGRSLFQSIFQRKDSDAKSNDEFFEGLGSDLDQFIEENQEWGREFLDDLLNQLGEGVPDE